jgi:ubiquinone/menaquinone biosynthesis C-methylase UbiE
MNLSQEDSLLEIFCGNGTFTIPFSKLCQSVVAVDFSRRLVGAINREAPTVKTVVSDVRDVSFEPESFSAALAYAGLQYLSEEETVALVFKLRTLIKPGGRVFIGDVPDAGRRKDFFQGAEDRAQHFNHIRMGTDTIGTWYDRGFLVELFDTYGFMAEIREQPKEQLNSESRFDVLAVRRT